LVKIARKILKNVKFLYIYTSDVIYYTLIDFSYRFVAGCRLGEYNVIRRNTVEVEPWEF